jgi:endoglycosylceramidase
MRRARSALLLALAAGALGAGVPHLLPHRPLQLPALRAEPDPVAGGRIVDAQGREVLLRGVNVNAFVEYWQYDPALFTTYPFSEEDADRIRAIGWNVVRLALSWSRIEPEPGVYDESYLDEVEAAVRLLRSRGVYSIIDLHQDAWSATLAARPDEPCRPAEEPAFGWDGAPAWATLDGGRRRCTVMGTRELSRAVIEAFESFWFDEPAGDGVGIQTRYLAMLGHLAARFSRHDAVAGYDVMNEPNVIWLVGVGLPPEPVLASFYELAVAAIREGERSRGWPARLILVEPSITWADFGRGAPDPFPHDGQIVYSPHVYQGGISVVPLSEEVFEKALAEAATLGGAPVLSGEWGSDPRRASDPEDGYFETHQSLQDRYRFHSTLWTWREACGDPHKAADARDSRVPYVWGLFEVDCALNQITGTRDDLVAALRRPLLRAAPGPIGSVSFDPAAGRYRASGPDATRYTSFVLFVPGRLGLPPRISSSGLFGVHVQPGPKRSHYVVGRARGGPWQIEVQPR